jgi:hypothetical protein
MIEEESAEMGQEKGKCADVDEADTSMERFARIIRMINRRREIG